VAGAAHLALEFRARHREHHFPGLFLSGIPCRAYFSRQQGDDNITVAPSTQRSARASERPDNSARFDGAWAGKECDDDLLEASAPNSQIVNRVRVIIAQDLGQQGDALPNPVSQQLLELRANLGRRVESFGLGQ